MANFSEYSNDPAEDHFTSRVFSGDFDLDGYELDSVASNGTSVKFGFYIKGTFEGFDDSPGASQSEFYIDIQKVQVLMTVEHLDAKVKHFDLWVAKTEEELRRIWTLLDPNYKNPEEFLIDRMDEVEFLTYAWGEMSASWCPSTSIREDYPCVDLCFRNLSGDNEE